MNHATTGYVRNPASHLSVSLSKAREQKELWVTATAIVKGSVALSIVSFPRPLKDPSLLRVPRGIRRGQKEEEEEEEEAIRLFISCPPSSRS